MHKLQLLAYSLKYEGDYSSIHQAISMNEPYDIPLYKGFYFTILDDCYPKTLKYLKNPPFVLYYRGNILCLQHECVSVIGSRNALPYAQKWTTEWVRVLSQQYTIVSGLAKGIDGLAHRIACESGCTIAVLGSGIDVIYPQENRGLYHEMCEKGLIISEFPLHTSPEPGNFPMRNRTISGLSRGVLVVEAKSRSGALITADFALEQGRDVFAIPGPISSKNSEGTNRLIKQGAILVSHIDDILEEYGMPVAGTNSEMNLQGELFLLDNKEIMVIKCMGYDPLHFDEILTATHSTIGELSASLMKMEAKGIIKGMPGNYYVKL